MKKILFFSLLSILSSYSFAADNSSVYRGLGSSDHDFLNFKILKKQRFIAKKPIFQEQIIMMYTS